MTGTAAGSGRGFVVALVLGFCALTSLPTIVAAARTPTTERFTGLVSHPYDLTYYVASQRGAAIGAERANRFTSERGAPGPVSPLYAGLGSLERAVGLPPASLFHLPQLVAAPMLVLLVWWISGLVHPSDRTRRRWAASLGLFGAGLAALTSGAISRRSADGAVFELTPILSVATFPHFAVAYVGLVLVWGGILSGLVGRSLGRAAGAGALGGLLLGVSHGFLLLPALAGSGALVAALVLTGRRPQAVGVVAASAAALLAAGPFLLQLSREQARFERLQGQPFPGRPSDAWWTWGAGQPILAVLLGVGVVVLLRSGAVRQPSTWPPAVWLGFQGALVFLPVTVFERRFSEGIMIPAGLLAGAGAAWLLRNQRRATTWALGALLVLPAASLAWQAGGRSLTIDRPTDELARTLGPDDVVLAGEELSWKLPAISDATTYLGRAVETLRYREKQAATRSFLADASSSASQSWLADSGITAIALDDRDATLVGPPAGACFGEVAYGEHLRLLRPEPACAPVPANEPPSAPG